MRFATVQIARALLITLLAGFFGAALVRFSPGFESDERDLDARLSAETREAHHQERAAERNVLTFYAHWLASAAHGDFGASRSMNRPVQQLIAERLPITARMIAVGGGIGLLAGFLAAAFTAGRRSRSLETVLAPANGLLLSAPPAVVALLFLWFNLDPALAIAVAVCPYVFRYAQKLLAECAAGLHVLTARAHGLSEARIFAAYILFPALAQLAAIAGITATVAFGAAIPVEVICDRPGLGQLAWQAAIGRDMPVLVTVTVLITIVIVAVNAVSEIAVAASPQARLAESK